MGRPDLSENAAAKEELVSCVLELHLLHICLDKAHTYPLSFLVAFISAMAEVQGSGKPPAFLGSSKDYNVDMVPKVPCISKFL